MTGYVALKLMPEWLATFMIKTGIAEWMTKFFKHSKRTVSEVLEELTDNKDLQTVLAYNFGDYGMSKQNAFTCSIRMYLNKVCSLAKIDK